MYLTELFSVESQDPEAARQPMPSLKQHKLFVNLYDSHIYTPRLFGRIMLMLANRSHHEILAAWTPRRI